VCVCVCVCIRTNTHTLHVGCSDVRQGVRTRHLEGPKNLDELILGINIFVYYDVYKVYI